MSHTQKFDRNLKEPPALDEIRNSIPKKCFEINTAYSIYFFFKDMFIVGSLYAILIYFNDVFEKYLFLYPIMWAIIGTYFWALFVVGHDCGHRSFSPSVLVCDIFGHISHSVILVPFHPWRLSHGKHHKNTGHVQNDESFVAIPEEYYRSMWQFGVFMRFYAYWLGGYFLYLVKGMPTHLDHSHYFPYGSIYPNLKNKIESTFSILCCFAMMYFLGNLGFSYGFWFLFKVYLAPYLVFTAWIATVTHLHHTHPDVPWYSGPKEWTYVKGALSTLDRNYGIVEDIHHNIGTHIVHHLFSSIPHYNLIEATKHMKPLLGNHHRVSTESIIGSMMTAMQFCRFVPDGNGVLYYVSNWREVLSTPTGTTKAK